MAGGFFVSSASNSMFSIRGVSLVAADRPPEPAAWTGTTLILLHLHSSIPGGGVRLSTLVPRLMGLLMALDIGGKNVMYTLLKY